MHIFKESLSAIQAAGAAAHHADTTLKSMVHAYADQVRLAMSSNPFDLQADSLFEEWKTVARLSQTLEQIEAELRNVHQAAQQLGLGAFGPKSKVRLATHAGRALPSSVAPVAAVLNLVETVDATDLVVKKPRRTTAKAAAKPAVTSSVNSEQEKASKKDKKSGLSPNTQKLLNHLKKVLSAKKFTAIKRTQEGVTAGLPSGSVTASLNTLLKTGYLGENASGGLKLISKK